MLSAKTLVRRFLDALVRTLGRLLGLPKLPMFFNGRLIWVDERSWKSIYSVYEPQVAEHLKRALRPGSTFYDVGAHHGVWSLYAESILGKKGTVFAFEPSPAFEILNRSAAHRSTIKPLRLGIGRTDGRATFFDQGDATSGSFVKSVTEINQPYAPEVPIGSQDCAIRSLDSIVAETGLTPQVIKMDVEGFEVEALKGASSLLRNKNVVWIIEVHPLQIERSGGSPQEVFQLLSEQGFRIEVIDTTPDHRETILAYHATT